jgi:PAS domain-containing protein
MSYETFLQDLHAVRERAGRFREQAGGPGPEEPALTLALEELDVALEELRVAEEEVRAEHEAMDDGRTRSEIERLRYQAMFHLAPASYLVTDPVGIILEANLRAAGLLGVGGHFLAGKPLASFVDAGDRSRFRDLIGRLPGADAGEWRILLRPRGRDPVQVVASVAVGRDAAGVVRDLRWILWPPPDDDAGPGGPPATAATQPRPAQPTAGLPALDDLAEALHEVADAAALLLRVDGAGLMLADEAGSLRWVTATGEAEQAFERAQRDLGEGPCVDAFIRGQAVWTSDLRADARWPRLAPAAAGNRIRGVLSVPVPLGGRVLGTVNAITHSPRIWTDEDAEAMRSLGAVTGRLLGSTSQARHRGDLVVQLQGALDSRVLVEQAKGVLMEREGLSAQAAFERLRRQARARSRKLDDVAREVIADRGL